MLKKILNTSGMIILIATIVIFSLIIGGNEKELPIFIINFLLGLNIIFLLAKRMILNEKIIKNKLDILVLCFVVSFDLPLFLNGAVSYQGAIEFAIKYFYVFSVYLVARNTIDTKKKLNVIVSTIIFSSLIFIVLGLDKINNNYSYNLLKFLNLEYSQGSNFSSTFGYANTVAIYLLFCIYLSINQIENIKNKVLKVVYCLYIMFAVYIIWLTSCRLVLLILLASVFIYYICKNYKTIIKNKKIVFSVIAGIIIVIGLFVIYISVGLKYSTPAPLETNKKIKKKLNPNEKYNITLDIDVENYNEVNKKEKTEIQIIQVNKYFQEKVLDSKVLNKNILEMEIIPTDSYYYLKVQVKNIGSKKLYINKCYINGEEYLLKCKYIPNTIYSFIQSFEIMDEGILQRSQFYEACLKMTKGHLLIGQGGNTWKKLYWVYEKYPYYIKESHSYFFELLISCGLVGLLLFLITVFVLYYKIIKEIIKNKEKRKQKLSILIGLGLLLLHSLTFEFNMSFIVVLLIVFITFAMLQYKDENENEYEKNKENKENIEKLETNTINKNNINNKIIQMLKCMLDYSTIVVLIYIFIVLLKANLAVCVFNKYEKLKLCDYNAGYRLEVIENKKVKGQDYIEDLKKLIEREPYYNQNKLYTWYWNKLFLDKNKMTNEEFEKYVNFGIKTFKEIKCEKTMDYRLTLSRTSIISNVVTNLSKIDTDFSKEKIKEIKEIVEKEYNEQLNNYKDCERNQMTEEKSKEVIEKYENYLSIIRTTN